MMLSRSDLSKVVEEKTGIDSGPDSIADAIWVGVTLPSLGAYLP